MEFQCVHEYMISKNEIGSVLLQIDSGDKMTERNTRPLRGLEWQTHQGALRHEHNKLMARVAVLNEQYRQFLDGEQQDDELVADAYLNVSIHCCDETPWMSLKDEAAINNELEEKAKTEHKEYVKYDDKPTIIPAAGTTASALDSACGEIFTLCNIVSSAYLTDGLIYSVLDVFAFFFSVLCLVSFLSVNIVDVGDREDLS
jgi:hypothetical protein